MLARLSAKLEDRVRPGVRLERHGVNDRPEGAEKPVRRREELTGGWLRHNCCQIDLSECEWSTRY